MSFRVNEPAGQRVRTFPSRCSRDGGRCRHTLEIRIEGLTTARPEVTHCCHMHGEVLRMATWDYAAEQIAPPLDRAALCL